MGYSGRSGLIAVQTPSDQGEHAFSFPSCRQAGYSRRLPSFGLVVGVPLEQLLSTSDCFCAADTIGSFRNANTSPWTKGTFKTKVYVLFATSEF